MIVEAEMLDSLSGIVQASGVRGGIGNPVSGSREAVTIDNIAPLIDGCPFSSQTRLCGFRCEPKESRAVALRAFKKGCY